MTTGPKPTITESTEIYCVKCKAKTTNAAGSVERVTMKNGRAATKALCIDCGTKKFRIGG